MNPQVHNNTTLLILKLDHNPLGSQGFELLAKGLLMNKTIQALSVTYCDIDDAASQSIFELLIYQESKMLEFNLSGNDLENDGIIKIFAGLEVAKSLQKIYLAANKFTEEEEVMDALHQCFVKNKRLTRYDVSNNDIKEEGVGRIIQALGEAPHVIEVGISGAIDEETFAAYKEALAANKPGKKKKGKKK